MIRFVHPWMLILWALIPFYVLWSRGRRRRESVAFPPLQYRPSGAKADGTLRSWWVSGLEIALLATWILAAARPFVESKLERIEDEGIDIVLVLDVSLSMLAEDFPPNRLAVLQKIARDFVDRSGGHRVGVVIFAGDTYVQSPLTHDRRALAGLLDSVSVHALNQSEGGGTAIGDALLLASQGLERLKVKGRDQAVVLITDGESNLGIDPMLAVRHLREQWVRLYAVGVGSERPQQVFFEGRRVGGDTPFLATLDDRALQAMAEVGRGRYFRAGDAGTLAEIFGELSRLESAPLTRRTLVRREESTAPMAALSFLWLAALCLVELRFGGRPWR